MSARLSIDLGGTQTRLALISPDGAVLRRAHLPTPTAEPTPKRIIEAVRQFRNDTPDLCPNSHLGEHTYDRSICRKVRDPKLAVACGPFTGAFSMSILAKD